MRRACRALSLSRASVYRSRTAHSGSGQRRQVAPRALRQQPRQLSAAERDAIRAILHDNEFIDQPPREIYGTLLSRGQYIGSVRTLYRLLQSMNENRERRRQRSPKMWPVPCLQADRPNQIWTWDISKLRGPTKGTFYYLYSVIDLYSRYVVAWMVDTRETGELATHLFRDTARRNGFAENGKAILTVHSDRGSPMIFGGLADLYTTLGIKRSLGRPRVSNDNAFSEAHFRTLKYQPDYPARFASLEHARAWVCDFVTWYNDTHCHSALALFTPSDVHHNRVESIAVVRQKALDQAYNKHPERFVRGRPLVPRPPKIVSINPDDAHRANTIRCDQVVDENTNAQLGSMNTDVRRQEIDQR